MNKINIQHAIDIMQRVIDRDSAFDMCVWRGGSYVVYSEAELDKCGTPACLGGWIGVSSEFIKDGGRVLENGIPEINGCSGENAIAEWLDISPHATENLCCIFDSSHYYPVYDNEVTPQMVIDKLKDLELSDE